MRQRASQKEQNKRGNALSKTLLGGSRHLGGSQTIRLSRMLPRQLPLF